MIIDLLKILRPILRKAYMKIPKNTGTIKYNENAI